MKYLVTLTDQIWRSVIVEADSKSEARKKAVEGRGEDLDWGLSAYNIRKPSAALPIDEKE